MYSLYMFHLQGKVNITVGGNQTEPEETPYNTQIAVRHSRYTRTEKAT